jgi:hypothetical protein
MTTFSDPQAIHLLTTLAAPRLRASTAATPPAADIAGALADTFGPAPDAPASSDADLARAALALAAEDPKARDALDALAEAGAPPTYGVVETVAVVTAAIAVLQTEVSFEKTPAGKWKVKLHKRSAGDALLKALAHAIVRALGGASGSAPRLPK